MKHSILIFLSFFISLFYSDLNAQAVMDFGGSENETYDFGPVEEGNVISYEFQFTNTGDESLTILYATASCGCTTPYWTKGEIAKGEKGVVKATFNSTGRPGIFKKAVTVKSNALGTMKVLFITGNVIPKQTAPNTEAETQNSDQLLTLSPDAMKLPDFSKQMFRKNQSANSNLFD